MSASPERRPSPLETFLPPPPDLTLPRVVTTLHRIAHAAGAIPIVVGVLVLIGWWRDIELFKRIAPSLVAMNPATAVTLIALGIALSLLAHADRKQRATIRVAKLVAAFALVIAILKLVAIASPIDPGIDQMLFRASLDGNRMAPNTALNFLLLGAAILAIDRSLRRVWPAQFLALATAMISLLALMGYAYGVQFFYGIGAYTPMSLPTAFTFFILSIGILAARPKHGVMAVIASNSSGGALVRRLLPAVIIVPLFLGWMRMAGPRGRLFESPFGLWLLVVIIMTVLAALVGWNGKLLFRADIERALTERRLAYHATHDALTGLPNRLRFADELTKALEAAKESGGSLAVLFVDLDRFKVINDSLGHVIGDELLIAAAKRIRDGLDEHQLAARLGGDEFTVLLPDVASIESALDVTRRIESAFESPFALGPHTVFTTVSIGIALSEPEDKPLNLIRHADLAMYQAKKRGRARHEIFDPSMDAAALRRLEIESGLRRAIVKNELRVFYQPEVEIESGRIVGMEALVRWESPEGLVSPSEFIPIAEESGLILPIGRWVRFEACRQAHAWEQQYSMKLAVSVNLSGRHFQQATLIDEVSEAIAKSSIDPTHLILEITETVAMEGAETTIEILRKLKALGVRLAIDDFGTGFSSLAYLKRFPVDFLKIDKSFVDGVAESGHDTAIIKAVIALGHALGLRMIAEGVESSDQVEQLRALGSEIGQGYYYGTPLTGRGMSTLLSGTPPWMKRP